MTEEGEENAPIFLSFNDLGVKINDRQILQNVSGKVHPGEMLAVMGPSGSGKTTLLNILAGRLLAQEGEILLNGKQLDRKLKKKICYVLQEDIFFANLTLQETLTFSAMLRLPDTLSKADKLQKVDQIVDNLDVRRCLDTKIGSPFERGLSGGEKKRANIGCELITNPSLIFLDEPTSGLDSSNALNLVKTLKNYAAREKKTVVTTIHQPSSQIFYMFDKLLLLCGGQVAFYGKASRVLNFFESVGLVCDAHFNPADFILEKVTEGEKIQEMIVKGWAERKKRHKKYLASSSPNHEVSRLDTPSPNPEKSSEKDADTTEKAPLDKTNLKVGSTQEVSEKSTETEKAFTQDNHSKSSSSSESLCSKVDSPRDISSTEPSRDIENALIPNGNVESEAYQSSVPLIQNPKSSSSKTSWKGFKRSLSKLSDDGPKPVHTEARLSSADFNVAVVTYKRSTSQDYTKIDVHDHDDEVDHSALYTDISTSWATSFWTQFSVLLVRTFKQSKPDILSKLNFVQSALLAIIAGVIWFQVPYKEESIQDRYSLIFFIVVYWNFTPLFQSLISFPNERTVVNKERAAGYYRLSAYYLAKLFSELPLVIFMPTLFLTIVYWMAGLNRSEAFLLSLLLLLLTAIAGQSVGLCIGATVMDFKKSIVVAAVYGLSCMLLGGFYQQNIPPWLSWFQYFAYLFYSYDALLSIEFSTSPAFSCAPLDSSYAGCRNNGTIIQGSEVLEKLNVSRTVGENIAALLLFIVLFRVLTYLALRFLHKPK